MDRDILAEAIAFEHVPSDFEARGALGAIIHQARFLRDPASVRALLLQIHWRAQWLAEDAAAARLNATDWTDPEQLAAMVERFRGDHGDAGKFARRIEANVERITMLRAQFARRKERRRKTIQPYTYALACLHCGADLPPPKNPGNPAKYCSTRCRVAAHRAG